MNPRTGGLALTFAAALVGWLGVQTWGLTRTPHPREPQMRAAAARAERAFAVVDSVKRAESLPFPADSPVAWRALLGEDYTPLTTTLGSREAKEASTNPAWAALMVRLLDEAGVGAGDTVVVLASGSFPALTLATASAVEALGAGTLLMSSLGASSYGANARGATWLDIESWVRRAGVSDLRSELVTAGGEHDIGGGLPPEGLEWLDETARRHGRTLPAFPDLSTAIAARTDRALRSRPAAVVNIGGGQAALGRCPHAAILPTGPWPAPVDCDCPERGALTRIAARDVPAIHLLNIRRLAARHGLDFEPGGHYRNQDTLYTTVRPRWAVVVAALALIAATLIRTGRKRT